MHHLKLFSCIMRRSDRQILVQIQTPAELTIFQIDFNYDQEHLAPQSRSLDKKSNYILSVETIVNYFTMQGQTSESGCETLSSKDKYPLSPRWQSRLQSGWSSPISGPGIHHYRLPMPETIRIRPFPIVKINGLSGK